MNRTLRTVFLAFGVGVVATAASAHGDPQTKTMASERVGAEQHAFGRVGDPQNVTRTIRVDMSDTMRFTPSELTIRTGETVRFDVRNSGKTLHEMVLGRMDDLKAHAELMRKHPGMEHDEPYMTHVAAGKAGRMVWQFTQPGEFHYGCLVPGHFEAGMVGKIVVR